MLRSVEQFGAPRVLVELVVAKIDAGRVDHHLHRAGTGGPVQRDPAAAAVELATPHRQPCQVVGLEAGKGVLGINAVMDGGRGGRASPGEQDRERLGNEAASNFYRSPPHRSTAGTNPPPT